MEVFNNATTNQTKVVSLQSLNGRQNKNGDMYFITSGVMGDATITLTISGSLTSRYAPLVNGAITSEGVTVENVPEECYLKVVISGATGTTDIDFHIK